MSEIIKAHDGGDGRRWAANDNFGQVQVKTSAYTIKSYESAGKAFSNRGATGSVTFTLPAPKAGAWFRFIRATPAQNIVITRSGSANIRGGATPFTGTSATASTASQYAVTDVISDGTDWYLYGSVGTWTLS
jgi:hypothetical protein